MHIAARASIAADANGKRRTLHANPFLLPRRGHPMGAEHERGMVTRTESPAHGLHEVGGHVIPASRLDRAAVAPRKYRHEGNR